MADRNQKTIYQKIHQAQAAVGTVPKNGYNSFHKYNYSTEADILTAVKAAWLDAGLVIMTSTTSEVGMYFIEKGLPSDDVQMPPEAVRWAKVVLSYQIVDIETGEKVEGTFDGYAEDKGDKAIYKATTGASKYFLRNAFGVATGDDPEKENQVPEQNAGRHVGQHHEPQKPAQQANPSSGPRNDFEVRRAQQLANEISFLQQAHGLSDAEICQYGGIQSSVSKLVELGYAGSLEKALNKIRKAV